MSHQNMSILREKLLLNNPKHRKTLITKIEKEQIKTADEINEGCSTVDLVLASENIFQTNLIQYFQCKLLRPFQNLGLCYLRFYVNIQPPLINQQPKTAHWKINRKGLYGIIS